MSSEKKFAEIEGENGKLEIEKAEIEARNAKLLKQVMEENIRHDANIAELKAEVAKLRYNNENNQRCQDNSPKEIVNVSNSIVDWCVNAKQKSSENREMDSPG
ncbi:2266_t:CDS:2 [Ambispora leptoticha]|uniref:2266_t:CDS:1 n=1 Tax=Ambispora leptoticha TaxID=144679 RepID=A0A9N9I0R1_9GLOM|nr:2266_t:CDS:2 [Ambispora leptoticha]